MFLAITTADRGQILIEADVSYSYKGYFYFKEPPYLATSNEKALDLLRRISPAAWQHLHFLGHYAFRDKRHPIDLEGILAEIIWE
jgi:hypothetical protein